MRTPLVITAFVLCALSACRRDQKTGPEAGPTGGAKPAASEPAGPEVPAVHPRPGPQPTENRPREPDTSELGRQLRQITLPPGFRIDVFARDLPNARSMAQGDAGTVFVGSRKAGNVYAVMDRDGDFVADEVVTIATNLNMPNGVAFRGGSLYLAQVDRIWRYDGIETRLHDIPKPVVLRDDFPSDKHHGWKYIAFGPDGWLYVPVGAPCNICEMSDPRYASITRMKADGSEVEVFAHGVRNSVGFDWHPDTGELWFTDNGRDLMGDDVPSDELDHAPRAGLHFGYPYCHAGDVPDPEFGGTRGSKTRWAKANGRPPTCDAFRPPARKLGAHVAALGMRFYRGTMFPATYRGRVFIPEHGSWNRSVPTGYRLTMVWPGAGGAMQYEVFAEGWLQGETAWGRPVALLELPDGSLLVSDDHAGAIYRVSYDAGVATIDPKEQP